ncbi:MAG: putative nucleotidyltransferase substrate binding domain-containing protein [Pseudomonadota bacterium]
MSIFSNIPLISHRYVVFSVKATGFDPLQARPIQISAVRLRDGDIDGTENFDHLINPHKGITNEASETYALRDQDVIDSSDFSIIKPQFDEYIQSDIVLTHNAAFHFTTLRSASEHYNLSWVKPRALCIQILARLVAFRLPDYSLYTLAKWLGLPVKASPSALDDAELIAQIFIKLLPLLRNIGIYTLAQAECACLGVSESDPNVRKASWVQPIYDMQTQASFRGNAELKKENAIVIDDFLYSKRVKDIMISAPVIVKPDMKISDVLELILQNKISSVFVKSNQHGTIGYGIVTERDILRAVRLNIQEGLELPVQHFMNHPLETVEQNIPASYALGRMHRLKVRHLGVVNADDELVGVLTAKDLVTKRAVDNLLLGDALEIAKDSMELGHAWAELPLLVQKLCATKSEITTISGIISHEICMLTKTAAQIAEEKMVANQRGRAPCRYCILLFGATGRNESLLDAEHESAIVYDGNRNYDIWFEEFSAHLSKILDAIGVPKSKGGILATHSDWRDSYENWIAYFSQAQEEGNHKDLARIENFLDAHPVAGHLVLGQQLISHATQVILQSLNYQTMIANKILKNEGRLNFLTPFKVPQEHINLRENGLNIISAMARLVAMRHDMAERSSVKRLDEVTQYGSMILDDFQPIRNAFTCIMTYLLRQQLADIAKGKAPASSVHFKTLEPQNRKDLLSALRTIEKFKKQLLQEV